MDFFSGGRRGGGGGGGLLPSTTATKMKALRKPSTTSSRRRGRIRDLLPPTSSFFTIGLVISLLFFLIVILIFGVPTPLSSSHSKQRIPRRTVPRRPLPSSEGSAEGGLRAIAELISSPASVDITTKDLYDRIEFLDLDGGPWKQGWEVTYPSHEWDDEKLKVFVVPHSHNDPGWKLTVEEYYNRQSRYILDTIVESLTKDYRRKFIWEEMSYLERWWREASSDKKENFIKLVKNGQLEIVGGGWVMNDEANSHYFAIIEQITEGNMWLNDTIGVIPRNSWAIDPFGYSATMPYLLRRMGFHNMLIQRTHYELKKELALHKNLEYIWRQSWDKEETTDIFVHMMPFYSYDIPHTCGPEPAICCQFDFARMRGFSYEACPWRIDPVETNANNVQERAMKLLDQYRKKSTLYRTNTLLVPLGDDFRYVSIDEAEAQFRNYQMLFDYINSNPSLNAEAMFGTLEDYFRTLREEAERKNFSQPGEVGSVELGGFPSLSGDFFTYADRNLDYWSGYYVSRPFFKAVDRVLEQTLRASEILAALVLGYCQKLHCAKLPISFSHKLTAARRNLALFQHHDGVTGTAKDHVVIDYGTRMHTSLQDLQFFMSRAVEVLLGDLHDKADPTLLSHFDPVISRSKYDVLPVHKVLDLKEGDSHSVVLYNPLEQSRDEIVMVVVSQPDVSVMQSNGSCVESQVSPSWMHGTSASSSIQYRLYWRASVPAMGLETYYVARGSKTCGKAVPSVLRVYSDTQFSCPSPFVCSDITTDEVQIHNLLYTLTFDVKKGLLQKITHKNGKQTNVGEEINMYSSSGSGAYLFKPIGEAKPIIEEGGKFMISEGPLVQEALSIPKTQWKNTPIFHSTRIYNAENTVQELIIEKEYHVELLGNQYNERELIVRFKTDIENKRVFYTDLNGFQMSRRETYQKIPLQGNYYPMPSLAFMQDPSGHRFSVHSKQSLGAASLEEGWLEIMLDRRLAHDDGRGLGQGVMDNRPMDVLFHILTESNVSALPAKHALLTLQPSVLSHRVGAHLNYPVHAFASNNNNHKRKSNTLHQTSFAPLSSSLPCDLHVVNFKVPQPLKFAQAGPLTARFVIYLQRRGWDSSFCKRGGLPCSTVMEEPVNLFYVFKDLSALNVKATTLNLLHDDTEAMEYIEQLGAAAQEGNVLMQPMEIQAYKLDLQPQT